MDLHHRSANFRSTFRVVIKAYIIRYTRNKSYFYLKKNITVQETTYIQGKNYLKLITLFQKQIISTYNIFTCNRPPSGLTTKRS